MYELKILNDQEFDALPFKYAKESLGCANPKTNTAYVRRVHWGEASKAINLLTIEHEINELVSKISPHEEDGIRYKKGRDIFGTIAPIAAAFIPGIGPLLSAAMTAGYGAYKEYKGETTWPQVALGTALSFGGAKLGQSMAGYQAGVGASKAVGGGWIGQSLSGAQSLLTGTSGAAKTLQLMGMPAASGQGLAASATGQWQKMMGAGNTLLGQTTTGGGAASTAGTLGLDFLKSPATKLGLGLMGMSALSTASKPPDIGPIVSKWLTADTVTRAGAKAKEIADVEYTGEWSPDKETTAFIDVMEKDIRKAYKYRSEQMDEMSGAINENWMRSGERLEMMRRLGEEEQREVDAMKAEWLLSAKQQYSKQKYDYVMSELKADEATKRDLLYGELSDVMWRYQIAEQDLMNFRQIAADAGMYMLSKGMGVS